MNVVYGLIGGFCVMGAVGGLEQDTMTITQCLFWSCIGFTFAGYAIKDMI